MTPRAIIGIGLAASASAFLFVFAVPLEGAQVQPAGIGLLLTFFIAMACVAGWWGSNRAGLTAPLAEAWVRGRRYPHALRHLLRYAALGFGMGVIGTVVALMGADGAATVDGPELGLSAGLVLALYGGIGEEAIFRLGLMSLIAGMVPPQIRTRGPMIAGIGVSAFLFGIVHAGQGVGDPFVQVALRFGIGAVLGFLYWRQGLESAMAAHLAYNLTVFYLIVAVV